MYKLHHWINDGAPYINATNLNEMDLGIASGHTYFATCNSAANAGTKTITINNFEATTLAAQNAGVPHVLYILFANGSTSSIMTLAINNAVTRSVKYRNGASISSLTIAENDIVELVYFSGAYYLIGSITSPLNLLEVARGGTGRSALTANAVLCGDGTNAVKMVATSTGALYSTSVNGQPQFGPLPVAQGGTGSTSAQNARTSLGIPTIYSGTGDPQSETGANGDLYFKYVN